MSKIISTNKLNRFWVNGIKPTVDKVKNTIKDRSSLMSNTEENKLVDALAIKEAIEHHDMFMDSITCGSLDEFLQKTAVKINLANHSIPAIGRVKDTTGWAPNKVSGLWYRFIVLYQNGYSTSTNDNINGNGIFWTDNDMWNVTILGIESTGFTLKYERVNKPTITNRSDLMANEVSGLFPDALAVKDAIKYFNVSQNNAANIATSEDFLELFAKDTSVHKRCYIRDTGGWGPKGAINEWYMVSLLSMNSYTTDQQYDTYMNGIIWSQKGEMWSLYIKGRKGKATTVTYIDIISSITPKQVSITSDVGTITTGYAYKIGNQLHISASVKIEKEVKAWDTSIIKISGVTFDKYGIYQQVVGFFYNGANGTYDNMWAGQWEYRSASLKSAKNLSAGNDYVRFSFTTICD